MGLYGILVIIHWARTLFIWKTFLEPTIWQHEQIPHGASTFLPASEGHPSILIATFRQMKVEITITVNHHRFLDTSNAAISRRLIQDENQPFVSAQLNRPSVGQYNYCAIQMFASRLSMPGVLSRPSIDRVKSQNVRMWLFELFDSLPLNVAPCYAHFTSDGMQINYLVLVTTVLYYNKNMWFIQSHLVSNRSPQKSSLKWMSSHRFPVIYRWVSADHAWVQCIHTNASTWCVYTLSGIPKIMRWRCA